MQLAKTPSRISRSWASHAKTAQIMMKRVLITCCLFCRISNLASRILDDAAALAAASVCRTLWLKPRQHRPRASAASAPAAARVPRDAPQITDTNQQKDATGPQRSPSALRTPAGAS